MPDPEAVRRLLEGEIDPVEIEDDAALYSMAERILGVSRTKPEEGYWKIDGNFLTLNHTKEDKEIDSIIYSKN